MAGAIFNNVAVRFLHVDNLRGGAAVSFCFRPDCRLAYVTGVFKWRVAILKDFI